MNISLPDKGYAIARVERIREELEGKSKALDMLRQEINILEKEKEFWELLYKIRDRVMRLDDGS